MRSLRQRKQSKLAWKLLQVKGAMSMCSHLYYDKSDDALPHYIQHQLNTVWNYLRSVEKSINRELRNMKNETHTTTEI